MFSEWQEYDGFDKAKLRQRFERFLEPITLRSILPPNSWQVFLNSVKIMSTVLTSRY